MSNSTPTFVDLIGASAIIIALAGFAIMGATTCSTDNLRHDIRKCVAAGATLEACYKQYTGEK